MATIVNAISRAFPAASPQAETLKQLVLLCLAGLFVSLLLADYGLDISAGFF